jgi:hypothetical protein
MTSGFFRWLSVCKFNCRPIEIQLHDVLRRNKIIYSLYYLLQSSRVVEPFTQAGWEIAMAKSLVAIKVPFRAIDNMIFRKALYMLRSGLTIPHAQTLS